MQAKNRKLGVIIAVSFVILTLALILVFNGIRAHLYAKGENFNMFSV